MADSSRNVDAVSLPLTREQLAQILAGMVIPVKITKVYDDVTGELITSGQPLVILLRLATEEPGG